MMVEILRDNFIESSLRAANWKGSPK